MNESEENPTTQNSQPLNIAFFVPWITQGKGGTEGVGSLIASGMAARGHNVFIYTFDDHHGAPVWPLDSRISLRTLPENDSAQSTMQMLLELQVDSPDVIVGLHMNRNFLKYVYAAWKLDLPLVLSEHINPEYPRRIGKFGEAERVAMFSGANRIHLLLDEFMPSLAPFLQQRARVIHNSVRLPEKLARPGEQQSNIILAVARLVPRKRIDLLLESFADIYRNNPDWSLQIAGYGDAEQELKILAKKLKISKAVSFLGQVDDTYPLYENASIFALPSETEGFPLTVVEAMAHALPVVGFEDCEGLNLQVVHQYNGLLASRIDRRVSLAAVLQQLIASPELRSEMGQAARQRFLQEYSQEMIFDQWEDIIADAAADKSNVLASSDSSELSIANARLLYAMGKGLENYEPTLLSD